MEVHHHKYSLFFLEEFVEGEYRPIGSYLSKPCFEYIDTFETLSEAKSAQKEYRQKTIILESH